MAITIDGKTFRNLPEQVKQNAEDIEELKRKANLSYQVVDELPESGEEAVIYLVPMEDGEEPNIYEEYMWINDEWELIGTTAVDLTNYVTLDGTQTITGVKTFSNGIKVGTDATATPNSWGTVVYSNTATGLYTFDTILESQTLRPTSSGDYDLGIATRLWRDLYLSDAIILQATTEKYKITKDDWAFYFKKTYDGGSTYTDCFYASVSEMYTRSVLPMGTNYYNLGTSTNKWKDGYFSGTVLVNKIEMDTNSNTYVGTTSNSLYLSSNNGDIRFNSRLRPTSNGSVDFGDANYKVKDIYLSGNLTDGTNSVSIADLKALIDYAKAQGWIS